MKILLKLMKKLHWSALIIIVMCLLILGGLSYLSMINNVAVPSNLVAVLSSIISLLIGYSAGRSEQDG